MQEKNKNKEHTDVKVKDVSFEEIVSGFLKVKPQEKKKAQKNNKKD